MLTTIKAGSVSGIALILLSACGNAEAPTDDSINSTSESTASSMESSTTTDQMMLVLHQKTLMVKLSP